MGGCVNCLGAVSLQKQAWQQRRERKSERKTSHTKDTGILKPCQHHRQAEIWNSREKKVRKQNSSETMHFYFNRQLHKAKQPYERINARLYSSSQCRETVACLSHHRFSPGVKATLFREQSVGGYRDGVFDFLCWIIHQPKSLRPDISPRQMSSISTAI